MGGIIKQSQLLYVREAPSKGRGVFAAGSIAAGTVIEQAPVVVLPAEHREHLDHTRLYDYYFSWGAQRDQAALALGFGSLYNHSFAPNVEYQTLLSEELLLFRVLRDVKTDEELTINYLQLSGKHKELWFCPVCE